MGFRVYFGGSWDLVSEGSLEGSFQGSTGFGDVVGEVISTAIRLRSNSNYRYPLYNPSYQYHDPPRQVQAVSRDTGGLNA